MQTVRVPLGKPYDAHIGYGLLAETGEKVRALRAPCKVVLVTDENVRGLYAPVVSASLARAGFAVSEYIIAPSESAKTMETVQSLVLHLAAEGLSRSDLLIALGGGVVGDITGFAAAIYLRGIDYVQVPTTLLSAVDASIGGKTAVNLPEGKNLVGAIWQPILVLCDCDVFMSLPHDQYLDGVAESLKYGVISDHALFQRIASGGLDEDPEGIIARCVAIKAEIVASDERETGRRQVLNLGHTTAHALETLSQYSISHGHAVAIGMVGAARIAETLGLCVMGCAGILMAMLDRLDLPSETSYSAREIAHAALADKKRRGDTITLVLPEAIGRCVLYPVPVTDLERLMRLSKGERE